MVFRGTVLPRLKGYTLINGVGQFWDSKKSTRPHLQGYTLVNGVRFRVYPYKWGRVYPYKRGRVYPCKWVCRGGGGSGKPTLFCGLMCVNYSLVVYVMNAIAFCCAHVHTASTFIKVPSFLANQVVHERVQQQRTKPINWNVSVDQTHSLEC